MTGKIIVLVEPDDRECRLAKEALQTAGYAVITVGDVDSAVAVFPYSEAALVVTAHPLPVPDTDRDFANAVKRLAPGTLVIGLVKRVDETLHALHSGCDAFLAKPIDAEALTRQVRQMVGPPRDRPALEP